MHFPKWLKNCVGLILFIVILIALTNGYNIYQVKANYPEIMKTLELSQYMISNGIRGENCAFTDFNHFPELKSRGLINLAEPGHTPAKEKFLEGVSNRQCIKDAKLIAIEYEYGHARATYACEKDGVITEFTWTDFKDSCSYMEYLKSWNLPIGKYSLLSVDRPYILEVVITIYWAGSTWNLIHWH